MSISQHSFTPQPPPPPAPLLELRPLSLGEILDRTFLLYRQRFWLFCGIASFAAAIATLGSFARLTFGLSSQKIQTAGDARAVAISLAVTFASLLLYLVAHSVTQAATVSAVSAAYLGRQTSIAASFRAIRPHWFRYILIVLWQSTSAIWIPTAFFTAAIPLFAITRLGLVWLGGILIFLGVLSVVYVIIAYLRNSLGVVASVSEDLRVPASMRRSKQLVAGSKGRVLAILLLLYVLSLVAGVLQGVLALFFAAAHGTVARVGLGSVTLLTVFTTSALVAPVPAIAFCLFYIDQRVRKEGFDLEVLLERAGPASPLAAPPPAV